MESNTAQPKLLVIAGPSASGKSSLALRVARDFNGELICADSWTVYKGFDIGTAKPSLKEQKEVPHHLFDVANPEDGFSAPLFKRLAEEAITDIQSRGKLPIMVGGTGLYIDSVIFDYRFLPPPDASLRDHLSGLSLEELIQQAEDKSLDLVGIDIHNKRRVIRAIENNGQRPQMKPLRAGTYLFGLSIPSEELKGRVARRVNQMLNAGLEEEVRTLAGKYGWDAEPMKGIGYREFKGYFEGNQSFDKTRLQIISATGSLVKRQRTWLKRNKAIDWFTDEQQAYDAISQLLNK